MCFVINHISQRLKMRIAVASVATFIDEQTHFVVGQANAALVSVACDEAFGTMGRTLRHLAAVPFAPPKHSNR
jgi:hypothetical protein